ncbi:MAG: PAS domain S-box protein [Burkholderiaceae bacterium]|jgi:two-component system sensor histidine kinase UhpB
MRASPESIAPQTLRILLIEDDEDDRDLILLNLQQAVVFEWICVSNAADLRQALFQYRWDVVVSDHRLPGFGSGEAMAMVLKEDPAPPFILVSGHIGETAAVEALKAGAVDFVKKDELSRLGPAVKSALERSELRRAAREAERALRDSEQRFRKLTELSPVGIYLTNARQECIYANEHWYVITGLSPEAALEIDWRIALQIGTDDAAQQATQLFAEDPERPLSFETRIKRKDRSELWVIGQMLPQYNADGDLSGHVGVITDITDRKRSELELVESEKRLRELSSHMVQIEERQRADIAREIHDEIGSSLTGIKIDLAWLKAELRELSDSRADIGAKFEDIDKLVDATAAVSRRLIKALRPSILDHGVVPAIQWQLLEFERRFGIRCHFEPPADEPVLSEQQSVAIFRVLQEALNNIAKHAEASQVEVTLFRRKRELTIEIRDNGKGLPGGKAERAGSFGVIGMRERIASLGGWLEIGGAPGSGVSLMIGIPYGDVTQLRRA